jgi:hypothetical protein
MAKEFDISQEAAARRFVELHPDDLAVVFCKDSRCPLKPCGKPKTTRSRYCAPTSLMTMSRGSTIPLNG